MSGIELISVGPSAAPEAQALVTPTRLFNLTLTRIVPWGDATPAPAVSDVTWRPPQANLHSPAIYSGVYEFLRAPPVMAKWAPAVRYLRALRRSARRSSPTLLWDRIRWTQAWLDELDTSDCSDAETVVGHEE